MVHRFPRVFASLLGLFLVCLAVLMLPWFLPEDEYDYAMRNLQGEFGGLVEKDSILGFRLRNNAMVSVSNAITEGNAVTYQTNTFGQRIVTVPEDGPRNKFLLFFGCSFTFGQNVDGDETLPSYAAQYADGYEPYNFGCLGYGPQHLFFQIQDKELLRGVKQPEGVAVYVFMADHVSRLLGDMLVFNLWMQDCPYLYVDDGVLTYGGSFLHGRPLKSFLYRFVWARRRVIPVSLGSYFLRPEHTPEDFQLLGKVVKGAETLFRKRFPQGRFLVLIYPNPDAVQSDQEQAINVFQMEGLTTLDASSYVTVDEKGFFEDGHPRPVTNKAIAELLAETLDE